MKGHKSKVLFTFFFLMVTCLVCLRASASNPGKLTASQVIEKVSTKLKASSGINASFTLSTSGRTVKGSLKSAGAKFALTTPSISSWYNGKSMWTYNAGSKETTVINPTQSELAETNPLLLISSGTSRFTAAFAKNQTSGNYDIVLTPKSKATGMKSIHVRINSSSMTPVRLVAVPSSGGTITVEISSLKLGVSFPASTFEYSKTTCRNATVVDLR